jgi:hypothetical protein
MSGEKRPRWNVPLVPILLALAVCVLLVKHQGVGPTLTILALLAFLGVALVFAALYGALLGWLLDLLIVRPLRVVLEAFMADIPPGLPRHRTRTRRGSQALTRRHDASVRPARTDQRAVERYCYDR